MTPPGRFDHLRNSALDLLAAGNSTRAVAQVLGVPSSVVVRWNIEGPVSAPVDVVAAQRAHTGAVHFRTTLTLTAPFAFRFWHAVVALLACGDVIVDIVTGPRHPGLTALNLLAVLAVVCGVAGHLRLSRSLLILGPDAAIVPRLLVRRSLPYADLATYWLVSDVRGRGDDEVEGRLLTLHSRRAGVRPIEVFIDDDVPVDEAVIERLEEVRKMNEGVQPLTPLGSITRA